MSYVFFWGAQDIYSQWHPSPFYAEGHRYLCGEQFMMVHKARLFGDVDMANEMLAIEAPLPDLSDYKSIKAWNEAVPNAVKKKGRQVSGFDE